MHNEHFSGRDIRAWRKFTVPLHQELLVPFRRLGRALVRRLLSLLQVLLLRFVSLLQLLSLLLMPLFQLLSSSFRTSSLRDPLMVLLLPLLQFLSFLVLPCA